MKKLENILSENMRRFGTKNLNETTAPKDNIININGSEPYVTVTYNNNGRTVAIDFDDYELTDRIDNYSWDGYIIGTDNTGQKWAVSAQAVDLGSGNYDWEIDWDTIEKH